jgi:hypothetical protein
MSESGDFDPGAWGGHKFDDARKDYDVHVDRSYDDAKARSVSVHDLIVGELTTDCSWPLVIVTDHTGSMGDWTATMFGKLGYLYLEAKQYLGEDLEICFAAVGDATIDSYPLQVQKFDKDTALRDRLQKLVIEKGGGNQTTESYELAAWYFLKRVSMPKAVHKPILVFIGDESPYSYLDRDQAQKYVGEAPQGRLLTVELFKMLQEKYAVYLISKPYGNGNHDVNRLDETTKRVLSDWRKLIGDDHIALLPSAERVVDVMFGILANEADRVDDFKAEIEGRQRDDQVKTVYKSLEGVLGAKSVKALPPHGKSITRTKDGGGKPTKPLM